MDIDNLCSYIQEIRSLRDKYVSPCRIWPSELLFRGQSNKNSQLLPYIARGKDTPSQVALFDQERNLIEMAKCKQPDIFRDDMKPVELLALLQHYGIPTRLLDLTENALVALYFACCSKPETDGEVFVFLNENIHVDSTPMINAIADTYRLTRGNTYYLEHFFKAAYNQPYFVDHRHIFEICNDENYSKRHKFFLSPPAQRAGKDEKRISKRKNYSRLLYAVKWIEEHCDRPLFVYAPVHTLRQQLQQGRFLLFPNRIIDNYLGSGKKAFETIIDPLPKDDGCIVKRFIIKSSAKKEMLKDLEACGICEATMFADNVDTVCKGIVDRVKRML